MSLTFPEIFTYIIAPLSAAIGAVWAYYTKVIGPAKLAEGANTREHTQNLEIERIQHSHLQEISYQEKVFDVIQDHQEFLEKVIDKSLDLQEIRTTINTRLDLINQQLAEQRQELKNLRHLIYADSERTDKNENHSVQ